MPRPGLRRQRCCPSGKPYRSMDGKLYSRTRRKMRDDALPFLIRTDLVR